MEAGGSSSAGGRKRKRGGEEAFAGGKSGTGEEAHNQPTESHFGRELLMGVVTGAMGSLPGKLSELLMEEYNLHKDAKKNVKSLMRELKSIDAALRVVAEVPHDHLDEQVKLWADDVRELSYNMEDTIDKFLVCVDGSKPAVDGNKLKNLWEKMVNFRKKGIARRQIANAIKEINNEVQEVANRRSRYNFENIVPNRASGTTIDPCIKALYTEAKELVGIYGKRYRDLFKLLSLGDENPFKNKLKIVSVYGFGGLGKTTLVKAVYDKIKGGFDSSALVPVGRNPDVKKIFRDILIGLDDKKYTHIKLMVLDERQLIDKIREFLRVRRYLVVIDDVWNEEVWRHIKLAFSNMNNHGSRLITTTRIASVSRACCLSGDSIYQMKPLSDHDSWRLFHKRVFTSKNKCSSELKKVSRDILKKCGGVPLAIITIASMLASDQQIKHEDEWHILLRSIGRGFTVTEDDNMTAMQRILSLSYYDLPSHLKTCLLYLSVYPEDHKIYKEELIWKWICENFVEQGRQETSIFEVGEAYFNELVNRSMIQPVYNSAFEVESCLVHDMVLHLLCSLSYEQNFVAILDGNRNTTSSRCNVRRLSLQSIKEDQQTTPLINSMSISQVRSITIFSPAINIMPTVSGFDVLRVLDLSGCDLRGSSHQHNFRDVVNLFHLRYLGLKDTGICELPAEIGNLQFLQVLDVASNLDLKCLPPSVCKLRRLMVVNSSSYIKWLPGVLGNLILMEVLRTIDSSISIVQELGKLARLRELDIHFNDWSQELEKASVESICNLRNIKSLSITYHCAFGSMDLLGERWVPPRHLCKFEFWSDIFALSTLPEWIRRCDPSHLSNLSSFSVVVKEVQQEDVQIIGRLTALRDLWISCTHQTERLLVISVDAFPCIMSFALYCQPATKVVFEQGALPRAEQVKFNLGVRVAREDGNGDDFELGLGNLLSLRKVLITIYWDGVPIETAMEAEGAVINALNVHPNRPITAYVELSPDIPEGSSDEDFSDDDDNEEE